MRLPSRRLEARRGGLILVDDVLARGLVAKDLDLGFSSQFVGGVEGVRGGNEKIFQYPRVKMVVLPAWDGPKIVRKI